MSRTNARKSAFYLVFQHDFVGNEGLGEAKDIFYAENDDLDENDKSFIDSAVKGTIDNLEEIDSIISSVSKGWSIERMAKVDLAILRLAVYEMQYDEEIPEKVAINEAVELAKKFGRDESPAFINGVLAKLVA